MNLGEFVLNEVAARDWLTNTVPMPALPGIGPVPHLAERLTSSGTPGHSGADAAALLSSALTTAGTITAPLGAHAAVAADGADSDMYRWFVTADAPTGRRLLVASEPLSAPALVNPRPGVDALLAVLTEAVQQANQLLRQVESFSAPHFAEAARAVEENLVVGQGATTDCGCGWPITQYDGVWLHVYNPELTGCDDHDAQP